jgi:hypothetical protein
MAALAFSVALLLAAMSASPATAEPARGLAGLTTLGADVDLDSSQDSLFSFLDAYNR